MLQECWIHTHLCFWVCCSSLLFSPVVVALGFDLRRCAVPCCAVACVSVCLRANNAAVKLAGLQAALAILCAPTPAIAAPPSAASPEVKALASKEEAAMVALSRCEGHCQGV